MEVNWHDVSLSFGKEFPLHKVQLIVVHVQRMDTCFISAGLTHGLLKHSDLWPSLILLHIYMYATR